MFDWIKKLISFSKKETKAQEIENQKKEIKNVVDELLQNNECNVCPLNASCKDKSIKSCFEKAEEVKKNCGDKKIIILLDDDNGILSLLEDDLKELERKGLINLNEYCIVKFSGILAVFEYIPFLRKLHDKIVGGIFDLTIGGIQRFKNKNIRLTGMDAIYANEKYGIKNNIVFSGNTLNPNIHSNQVILEQYKKITGRNLMDDIIFKSSFNEEERQQQIYEKLFKKLKDEK